MNKEELIEALRQFDEKRVEELPDKTRNMFYAIMKIADERDRLNNIIDTMLEFSFFKEECPLNFGFGDEKEEKAQDVFYEDDYCEENCNDIYKKCWLKYFEKLQELKEENK